MAKVTNGGSECRTITKALARNGEVKASSYGALRVRLGLVRAMGTDTLRVCLASMARMSEVKLTITQEGITVSLPN